MRAAGPCRKEDSGLQLPSEIQGQPPLTTVISFSPDQRKRAGMRVQSWNPCILRARVGLAKRRRSGTVIWACCAAEVEAGTCAV